MRDSVEAVASEDETGIHAPTGGPQVAGESGRVPDGPTGDGLVQIAYCHESRVSHSWHTSMLTLYAYDKSVGGNVIADSPFMVSCSGPRGLIEGRNDAVRYFLDKTPHEWLFWVDTDMGFQADALDRLLAAADPATRPVIGGLCFALKLTGPDGFGGFNVSPVPTIFGLAKDKDGKIGFINRSTYPPDALVQAAGTGAAFILIHRSVLEDVRLKHGDDWYSPICYENGREISEDLSFCWRVNDIGRPIYVHSGVKTTHHKEIWLGEDDYHMPDSDPIFKTPRPTMEMPR